MTDLNEYTLMQLKKLQARIAKEVAKRESDNKSALLKRLRKLAREEGVELEELLGTDQSSTAQAKAPTLGEKSRASTATKTPLPAKYRNPNNLDQGWSGRGRKPAWFEAWVNNGGSLDALQNAAQSKGRKKSITASSESTTNDSATSAPSPYVTSTDTTSQ